MIGTKRAYSPTPVGTAIYPWVNKPDTKFNSDGVFKVDLALEGAEADKLREIVDKAVAEAFEAETKDMTAAERKKWSTYAPYEIEEDEEGKPTGRTIFRFRQNATIRLHDGDTKNIRVGIYDSADKPTEAEIWSGARIRVKYRPRPVKVASIKKAGVRLDFLKVQVVQLADRDNVGGFGGVEGGYTGEEYESGDPLPDAPGDKPAGDEGDF